MRKISAYSYQKGETVYLEEDCDASLVLDALDAKGIEYQIESVYQKNTPIRRYNGYSLTTQECDETAGEIL